jgi:hypothetical protein
MSPKARAAEVHDRARDAPPLIHPYGHHAGTASDRLSPALGPAPEA